jgi:diguanylate cyclase (GGDEF)-like protein
MGARHFLYTTLSEMRLLINEIFFVFFFVFSIILLFSLSSNVKAALTQHNSCQMILLVDQQTVTEVSPQQSEKARIRMPIGESVIRLTCSLSQQAVFSFNRHEIVNFTLDDQGGSISQIRANKPSFVLPIGEFSADFEIVSHHEYIQQFVWQDFASYVNQSLINNITMGAFYGLCLTLILYVFFMGRILSDERFELYSLYVFCAAIFFLLQEGQLNLFVPEHAFVLSHQFFLIFAGLTVFTATIFLVRLTDLHLTWPKISRYGLHGSATIVLIASIAMSFLEHNVVSFWLGKVMSNLTLIIMLILLYLLITQSYRGVRMAWLVLFSLLLMAIAMIFRLVLTDVDLFLNRYALIIAFAVEAFMLAVVVSSRIKDLKLDKIRAQIDANTDVLCNVLNRRGWGNKAHELLQYQEHNKGVLSLLYIDINDFKVVNDTHGHDCGDQVLQIIAKITQNQIRTKDLIGRVGGDEFVALGHFNNTHEANQFASRIDQTLRELSIRIDGLDNIKISASVGHVIFESAPDSVTEMLKSADKSMYKAKQSSKLNKNY